MKPASALAIYLLFWALTLFAVLPFGVRTADEAGQEPVPGQADSAPQNPMLVKKLIWTTVIATLLFALFLANYVNGWIGLDDIPGWQRSGPYRPDQAV
jgi:predicted secreted protein